jgi:D-3-phosphoglycerate dehydrogenase / 2-oxoglutarate reductase
MKIALVSPIDAAAIDVLAARHDVLSAVGLTGGDLGEAVADREIFVARSGVTLAAELLRLAPSAKLVIRAGSGLDNLDLDYMREARIRVVRIPGPGARAVAEMTFGLLLAVGRRIAEADRLIREGRWTKHELAGRLLAVNTLGIIGIGSIGSTVGRMGIGWGMRVIGYDINVDESFRARIADLGIEQLSFDEVVEGADLISIHVPLLPSTRHLIDSDVLARMKPGSILVNIARGGIVDDSALLDSLARGHLGGAALDVHEREGEGIPPLAALPNVVLTPHIGAMAAESQRLIGQRVVEIVEAFGRDELDAVLQPAEFVT